MTDAEAAAKVEWPSWRFGPDGQQQVFNNEDEVPSGWEDHPSKVGSAGEKASLTDDISDDDDRIDTLMAHTQPDLVEFIEDYNNDCDDGEEVEFSKSWPKLKLSKTILAHNVPFTEKDD